MRDISRRRFLRAVGLLPGAALVAQYRALAAPKMGKTKIREIKVMILQGPRTYTLVKVESDAGLYGIGEAYGSPGVGVKEGILTLKPELIGKDPPGIDVLITGLGWRSDGSAHMLIRAISGIEMALWDLAGKTLGVPTTTLLGRKFRDRVRMYDHSAPRDMMDPASCREWAQRVKSDPSGFRIHKFGFEHTDPRIDPARDRSNRLLTASELTRIRRGFENCREAISWDHDIMVHCHWEYDLRTSIQLAEAIEPIRPLGLEDPMSVDYPRAGGGLPRARRSRSARARTSADGKDSRISSSIRDVTFFTLTCARRAGSWRPGGSPTSPRSSSCRWQRITRAALCIQSQRPPGRARSAIFWPRRP